MTRALAIHKENFTFDLSDPDFEYFSELILRLSGITLKSQKRDLISSRLRPYLRERVLSSFSEYRKSLEALPDTHPEKQNFLNLLTTNKTDFFRESQHFDDVLTECIPRWRSEGKNSIKIWCCASSTGEEPFSLAMVLERHLPKPTKFRVIASDIDTHVLEVAKKGVYPETKLPEIPKCYQKEFLSLGQNKVAGWFKIKDSIFRQVEFLKHNLISSETISEAPFDLILCRNVMIYFQKNTISALTQKLHRSLAANGLLFIGHSECLQNSKLLFKSLKPSVFQKI